jgi:very-short-patch-repair endonuclease
MSSLDRLVNERIEALRPKLLDTTRRNPLIQNTLTGRVSSYVSIVDEKPQNILNLLAEERSLRIAPLPPLDEDNLPDEVTTEFLQAFKNAQQLDDKYVAAIAQLDYENDSRAFEKQAKLDRELKDKVRSELELPPRPTSGQYRDLVNHAKIQGINPSTTLPEANVEAQDSRHDDNDLQTLLLPETLSSRMQKIYGKQREFQEERGLRVTYLVLGYLWWTLPDAQSSDDAYKSPLVIVPVQIDRQRSKEGEIYSITQSSEPEFNPVLKQKLEVDAGLELPEMLDSISDGELDIESLFSLVQGIQPRRIQTWEIKREATLGIYPFQGLELHHDLRTDDIDFSEFGVLRQLMVGREANSSESNDWSTVEFDTEQSDSIVPHLVLDADSSQYLALMKVASGENVALEGPPGSGKSQTIVNAIANALHDGKRVLFVAQKMTALEVVYARLQALNLEKFVLPMRGSKTDTKGFYDALKERLDMERQQSPQQIPLFRHRLRQQRDQLASYISLITDRIEGTEITAHQLMGLTVQHSSVIETLPLSLRNVKIDLAEYAPDFGLPHFISCQQDIISWAEQLGEAQIPNDSPWSDADLEKINYDRINQAVTTGDVFNLQLSKSIEELDDDVANVIVPILETHNADDIENAIFLGQKWKQTADQNWHRLIAHSQTVLEPLNEMIKVLSELREISNEIKRSDSVIAECGEKSRELHLLVSYLQINGVKDCANPTIDSLLSKNNQRLELFRKAVADYERLVLIGLPVSPRSFHEAVTALESLKNDSELLPLLRLMQISEVIAELDKAHRCLRSIYGVLDHSQTVPSVKTIRAVQTTLANTGFFGRLGTNFKSAVRDAVSWLGIDQKSAVKREGLVAQLNELLESVKALSELSVVDPSIALTFDSVQGFKQRQAALNELVVRSKSIGLQEEFIARFASEPLVAELHTFLRQEERLESSDWRFLEDESKDLKGKVDFANEHLEALISASSFCYQHGLTQTNQINRARVLGEKWTVLTQQTTALGKQIGLDPIVPELSVLHSYVQLLNAVTSYSPLLLEQAFGESDNTINKSIVSILPLAKPVQSVMQALTEGKGVSTQDRPSVWAAKNVVAAHLGDKLGFDGLIQRGNTLRLAGKSGFGQLLRAIETENRLEDVRTLAPAIIVHYIKGLFDQQFGSQLLEYSGTTLDSARRKLQEVDRQLGELAPRAVSAKTFENASPAAGIGFGPRSGYTDMALIKHELAKQRKLPPRKLLKRARNALSELFPCWMMVPSAVAQFLPREEFFDLVIIDEASQMTPETSISALMRAGQALISGDTNQLPPTNFFQGLSGGTEDADEDIDTSEESILELANTQFHPKHRLQWHYRSRHESLIAFSNHYVYDNELVIFPSPVRNLRSMGVSLVQINGTFHRGINPVEAQVIFEHIIRFMREQPDRTLGVVVMNQSQMEQLEAMVVREAETDRAVAAYIDRWAKKDEGLERFFVKNLENVQGDERDVIFIGTTYGRDPNGKFYQRFGPINGPSGKRRLNVLFTRAKEQIVTFTSIPLEIYQPDQNNEGARLLKLWLQYSSTKRLGESVLQSETGGIPDSPFEEHVISAIESVGYKAIPQVGVSNYYIDIGVKHPDYPLGYICGVECDGATYHSAKSARDRDRLRQEVLERLGWELYRIWSTDWFRDPYGQTERLKDYLDRLLASKVAAMPPILTADVCGAQSIETSAQSNQLKNAKSVSSILESSQSELSADETNGGFPTRSDYTSSATKGLSVDPIDVGSKVLIRYLDGARAGSTVRLWLTDLPEGQSISTPDFILLRPEAPLAKALIDSVPGDIVSYQLKEGIVRVEVVEELN